MPSTGRVILPAILLAGTALAGAPLAAQAAGGQVAATEEPGNQLADIVVTGRLRTENLQDVPLAITAFDAGAVEQRQLDTVADLQRFVPNVQLSDIAFSGNALAVSIRGISFADLEKTFENAIGVSIDGVFLGTNTGAAFEIADIESIEVLRGPQGTLQGRNTIGGAINIRRTRPTEEAGVRVLARYSRYNNFNGFAILNSGRIADGPLMAKGFVSYRKGDSHTFNLTTNRRDDGPDYVNGGVAFLFQPEDSMFDALLTVEYMRDRSRFPSLVNLTKANLTPAQQADIINTVPPPFRFGAALGRGGTLCDAVKVAFGADTGCDTASFAPIPHINEMNQFAATMEIRGEVRGVQINSITGYRSSSELLIEENTGAPPVLGALPLFVAARDTDYSQMSQELNARFDIGTLADVVGGIYYLWTEYRLVPGVYNNIAAQAFLLNAPIQNFVAGQQLDSFALFAEAIWNLSDRLRLTTGARYTFESKNFFINTAAPVQFAVRARDSWRRLTGRVIADFRLTDDALLYGGWSRGFRSGGFNGRAASPAAAARSYDPETVDSFEAGAKLSFLDNRLRVNPTAFYATYRDVQQDIIVAAPGGQGTNTFVENAGGARIYGFELEAQARVGSRINLLAAFGYLNAKYTRFEIEDPANPGTIIDVKDQRQWRRSPDFTVSIGGDYRLPAGPGEVVLFANYSYIDEYATSPVKDPFAREIIEAQSKFDVSLGYEMRNVGPFREARITGFARDILHKDNGRLNTTLNAGIFFFGVQVPARIFGVEAVVGF
jgi:iron complex outermembrane receptor protein